MTRIDLTMETMRLPFKRKTVRFTEHNEIFLIPPWETPPILTVPNFDVQDLQNLFLIYFTEQCLPSKTPILAQLLSLPMFYFDTCLLQQTFNMSTNYSLVEDTFRTITQPLFCFNKWSFDRKKNQIDDYNTNKMNSLFSESLLKQPLKRLAQMDSTQSYNQSYIYEKKETTAIIIGLDCLHLWYHLIHLPFLPPFNDQDNNLIFPQLLLITVRPGGWEKTTPNIGMS